MGATTNIDKYSLLDCMIKNLAPVLGVEQMAAILNVSATTMRNIITGKTPYTPPPCFKIGESWKCTLKGFDKWCNSLPIEYKMQNTTKKRRRQN